MKRPKRELQHEAEVATMEILRLAKFYEGRNDLTDDHKVKMLSREVIRALEKQENIIDAVIAKSIPLPKRSGSTRWGREMQRTHNISTRNGYGFGCTICGGDIETETFMSLEIGNYRMKVLIDFCYPCAKRLLNVCEARFEDKRRARFMEMAETK